jgi:hypothetical protein
MSRLPWIGFLAVVLSRIESEPIPVPFPMALESASFFELLGD